MPWRWGCGRSCSAKGENSAASFRRLDRTGRKSLLRNALLPPSAYSRRLGIKRCTDGNVDLSHNLAPLSRNEAIRLRGLLNDVLASVMSVPARHNSRRNVTQH